MWTQIVGSRGSTMEPLWQLPSLHCQRKGICFFSLCMSPSYSQDLNTVDPHRCTSLLLSFCSSPLISSVHSHLRKWGKIHFRFCAREEPPSSPSWTTYSALVKQSVPSWGKISANKSVICLFLAFTLFSLLQEGRWLSGQEVGFPGSLSFPIVQITLQSRHHHLLSVTCKVCQQWSGNGGKRTLLFFIHFWFGRGKVFSQQVCIC